MIRIKYLWTVAPGDEDQFVGDWQEGTGRIQANCAGAFGSFLIRDQSQPTLLRNRAMGEQRGVLRRTFCHANSQPASTA
jgi:hypothetical protein